MKTLFKLYKLYKFPLFIGLTASALQLNMSKALQNISKSSAYPQEFASDSQIDNLRAQIISSFPEMEEDLRKMSKQDLKEVILELSRHEEEPEEPARNEREEMCNKIAELVPSMKNQLSMLNDDDIRDIYLQMVEKSNSMEEENIEEQETKKRVIENGEVNVRQMKRTLIDRLPEYRIQITNMEDGEIKNMFENLKRENQEDYKEMEESNASHNELPLNRKYNESSSMAHFQSEYPFKKRGRPRKTKQTNEIGSESLNSEVHMNSVNSKTKRNEESQCIQLPNYSSAFARFQNESQYCQSNVESNFSNSLYSSLNARSINSNQPIIVESNNGNEAPALSNNPNKNAREKKKSRHKCKIVFYLDEEDFEQPDSLNQNEKRKSGIAKILHGLSKAFNPKE